MANQPPSANARGRQRWFVDPTALMQIKSLTLRAKTVVEGFTAGLHRSPVHGFSVEFSEYRPYSIGDDPRRLDWKLLARTDRYYVKEFEDETNRRCYVAVDQSKSMGFGSATYSKAEYARTLAATLAYYLSRQRDAVGVATCGVPEMSYLPPRNRPGHLQQIMKVLEQEPAGTESVLAADLSKLAQLTRRRGLVVLVSDLLTDPESLFQPLGYLAGRGHEVVIVRVLDRSEIELNFDDSSMLVDMENGREMYIDPRAARDDYRRRFDAHEQQLLDICHRRNARLLTTTIDQPLEGLLLDLISSSGSLASTGTLAKANTAAGRSGQRPIATSGRLAGDQ